MKHLLCGILMTAMILATYNTYAQQYETDLTLSASSGYSSNTYLMPMVPDWDQSEMSVFNAFTPSGTFLMTGTGRSLSLSGTGQLMHISGDRPNRAAGYLSTLYRQRITSSISARALGGLNIYSTTDQATSFTRDMQWFRAGFEWLFSPFAKFELTGGSSWRTYDGLEEGTLSSRYDAYSLGLEYWPGFRWQLKTDFHSSLSHIADPGNGFISTISVSRFHRNGTMIRFQTGLEQYSSTFSSTLANEAGSRISETNFYPIDSGIHATKSGLHSSTGTDMGTGEFLQLPETDETITLEDRFHRTSLQVYYPVGERVTLSGTLSGLLWFSSEDDQIEPDFQVSAGVRIPFSIQRSQAGEFRSFRWESTEPQQAVLTVEYKGDQPLYITGDFNDWENPGIPFQKTGRNRYQVTLELSPGTYEYKIGKRENDQHDWLDFPDHITTVSDGFGGENGRVFIDY